MAVIVHHGDNGVFNTPSSFKVGATQPEIVLCHTYDTILEMFGLVGYYDIYILEVPVV